MFYNHETYLILFVSTEICYTVFLEQFLIILLCKPLLPATTGITLLITECDTNHFTL